MCPDPQLISIYMDGELPSPWKEKMEAHLAQCSGCRNSFENFKKLHDMFKPEHEFIEEAKEKVWRKLETRQRFRSFSLWQRRLHIPLPAAAAAAIVLAVLTILWIQGGGTSQSPDPSTRSNIILAFEEEMPGIIPAADMNGVLQFLSSDGTDILIMRLPESRNFSRSGEPAIIRAADFRRNP